LASSKPISRLSPRARSPELLSHPGAPSVKTPAGRSRRLAFGSEQLTFHNLATAARRLCRQRFSEVAYERVVDKTVAAYLDWREKSTGARWAYGWCDATSGVSEPAGDADVD
jgi:hypothetical protein